MALSEPGWEESDLEQSIYDNLRDFILEVGRGFCFEARQQKILIDDTYERLFLSEYQLQLPAKEQFTAFLKKENEGLPAAADAKSAKGRSRANEDDEF